MDEAFGYRCEYCDGIVRPKQIEREAFKHKRAFVILEDVIIGVCDRCGGELYQRDDDREETIANRLKVYEKQTAPLANYYRERGLLREIDGVGEVNDIRARVTKALGDVVT